VVVTGDPPVSSPDFDGYRVGDLTYCVDPATQEFFPVRVVKVGKSFLDVEALDDDLTAAVAAEFIAEKANRRFVRPRLPASARFGGSDERLVNSRRASGPELRLLPCHYGTYTNRRIRERHAEDPVRWPLPTGEVFERWFREEES
jgi:hypothetical protein